MIQTGLELDSAYNLYAIETSKLVKVTEIIKIVFNDEERLRQEEHLCMIKNRKRCQRYKNF